ncbi:MAG: RHS repeat protein, partial [bacterium]|nr:RHS repeat protein [bacterium]
KAEKKRPWVQTTYDYLDRPTQKTVAHGQYGTIDSFFSYSGFSLTVTDPDGVKKTEGSDYLGGIIRVIEHTSTGDFTTQYTYNAAGDLLKIKDSLGHITPIEVDTLGRKVKESDPDLGTWFYGYDQRNNLISQSDAKSQTITYTYDELNRITKKSNPDGTATVYTYDSADIVNGIGQPATQSNENVTTRYKAYDRMGRIKELSKTIIHQPHLFTKSIHYDVGGRITSITYPNEKTVFYEYHAGTLLLKSVSDRNGKEYARISQFNPGG